MQEMILKPSLEGNERLSGKLLLIMCLFVLPVPCNVTGDSFVSDLTPSKIGFRPFKLELQPPASGDITLVNTSSVPIQVLLPDDDKIPKKDRVFFVDLRLTDNQCATEGIKRNAGCQCPGSKTTVCGCGVRLENARVFFLDNDRTFYNIKISSLLSRLER